ncbi:hypothetical protein OEA41_000983 [Lepraria neglecta]|uniref:Uncharacterized protein n=1 Tax=Lepraria neglecta TaxID=209136 RepID=A0AAD9ZGU1_9LECA|nr:hypothetical protein OEA41_000983 [Lepraria neglecta]
MAPHEQEWLFWSKKFEIALTNFKQQLADNLPKDPEHIPLLIKRVKDLAASSENLQEENNALKDRVRLLEQEANQQDQLNARKSQEQQNLETKNKILKEEFYSVVSGVETFTRVFETEREQSKAEMQELRSQVEALLARENVDASHAQTAVEPRTSRSRAASEATTVDDSMNIDRGPTTQPTLRQYLRIIPYQNDSTLEEYLAYADEHEDMTEIQAVKDYVNGMNEFARRKVVWDRLDETGFTWANAKTEVQKMVGGLRRRSQRRRLPALVEEMA